MRSAKLNPRRETRLVSIHQSLDRLRPATGQLKLGQKYTALACGNPNAVSGGFNNGAGCRVTAASIGGGGPDAQIVLTQTSVGDRPGIEAADAADNQLRRLG